MWHTKTGSPQPLESHGHTLCQFANGQAERKAEEVLWATVAVLLGCLACRLNAVTHTCAHFAIIMHMFFLHVVVNGLGTESLLTVVYWGGGGGGAAAGAQESNMWCNVFSFPFFATTMTVPGLGAAQLSCDMQKGCCTPKADDGQRRRRVNQRVIRCWRTWPHQQSHDVP